MKRLVLISVISLVMFTVITASSTQTPRQTKGHSEWVAQSLSAIETIKVGMTRRDLLKLFTVEGGDVTFEPVGMPQDKLKEHMEDRITGISKPYLQRSVID